MIEANKQKKCMQKEQNCFFFFVYFCVCVFFFYVEISHTRNMNLMYQTDKKQQQKFQI